MVFGKKKKKEEPVVPVPPTEVLEAAAQTPKQETEVREASEDVKFVAKEFQDNYDGVFHPDQFVGVKTDTVQLSLLFAIFAELRLLRKQIGEE